MTMTTRPPRANQFSDFGTCLPGNPSRLRAGVYGASGTTGTEMIRLLLGHPHCAVAFATSREFRGKSLKQVDLSAPDILLVDPEDVDPSQVDVVFVCLPHGAAAECAKRASDAGVRVVDLSGDLRLRDAETHQRVYGTPRSEAIIEDTVYGLTETNRARIREASVVSNPGCYPTCSGLALWPLLRERVPTGPIVINALSGVSGAGRTPTHQTHFCSVTDDVRPYKLGRSHRHVAEMEQFTRWWTPRDEVPPQLVFNPHVIPIERGMLATITLTVEGLTTSQLRDMYEDAFAGEAFVSVLPEGMAAQVRGVVRTNQVLVGIEPVPNSSQFVITSAIDNLLKGAAGQALQNMNLMFGLPEDAGFVVTSGVNLERSAPVREVRSWK